MKDRPTVLQARSRLANDARAKRDQSESRRLLAEAKLAQYIKRVVDSAPPLTNEQRDRLAVLLRGAA